MPDLSPHWKTRMYNSAVVSCAQNGKSDVDVDAETCADASERMLKRTHPTGQRCGQRNKRDAMSTRDFPDDRRFSRRRCRLVVRRRVLVGRGNESQLALALTRTTLCCVDKLSAQRRCPLLNTAADLRKCGGVLCECLGARVCLRNVCWQNSVSSRVCARVYVCNRKMCTLPVPCVSPVTPGAHDDERRLCCAVYYTLL